MNLELANLFQTILRHPRKKIFYLTKSPVLNGDWTPDHETPCSDEEIIVAFAVIQ